MKPAGRQVLAGSALIAMTAAGALPAQACPERSLVGTLVGRFSDGVWTFRQRVKLVAGQSERPYVLTLKRAQQTCRLTLYVPESAPAESDVASEAACDTRVYAATLSCLDGRNSNLVWRFAGEQGSYGYSSPKEDAYFVFSVGRYVDSALDILEKAKEEYLAQEW